MTTQRELSDGRLRDYGCGIGVTRRRGEIIFRHTGAVRGSGIQLRPAADQDGARPDGQQRTPGRGRHRTTAARLLVKAQEPAARKCRRSKDRRPRRRRLDMMPPVPGRRVKRENLGEDYSLYLTRGAGPRGEGAAWNAWRAGESRGRPAGRAWRDGGGDRSTSRSRPGEGQGADVPLAGREDPGVLDLQRVNVRLARFFCRKYNGRHAPSNGSTPYVLAFCLPSRWAWSVPGRRSPSVSTGPGLSAGLCARLPGQPRQFWGTPAPKPLPPAPSVPKRGSGSKKK